MKADAGDDGSGPVSQEELTTHRVSLIDPKPSTVSGCYAESEPWKTRLGRTPVTGFMHQRMVHPARQFDRGHCFNPQVPYC